MIWGQVPLKGSFLYFQNRLERRDPTLEFVHEGCIILNPFSINIEKELAYLAYQLCEFFGLTT